MIESFGFNSLREVIAAIFMLGGLVFFIGSAIGMLRLPDFIAEYMLPAIVRPWVVPFLLSV